MDIKGKLEKVKSGKEDIYMQYAFHLFSFYDLFHKTNAKIYFMVY